jgi:ferredoxin--NADP+ reductase
VRTSEVGERIPLTIAAADPEEGWVSVIVQAVGATTTAVNALEEGDFLVDVAGPLGSPTQVRFVGTVVVIGGGVGTAIAYPSAVAYRAQGNTVIGIIGGRSRGYVILETELRETCDELHIATDDGTLGRRGLVTDALDDVLATHGSVDLVLAIGPVPMMKAVSEVTRRAQIHTVVSLNPIMVDGTGMCGGCRVLVGGETKFACIDGPEFDAHLVDFEVLERRNRAYLDFEAARRVGSQASS